MPLVRRILRLAKAICLALSLQPHQYARTFKLRSAPKQQPAMGRRICDTDADKVSLMVKVGLPDSLSSGELVVCFPSPRLAGNPESLEPRSKQPVQARGSGDDSSM